MNVLVLIASCLVGFIEVVFALVIFRGGLKEKLNKSCFFFLFLVATSVLFNYLSNVLELGHIGLLYVNRALFIVSLLEIYSIFIFVVTVTQQYVSRNVSNIYIFLVSIISVFATTPLIVKDTVIGGENISYVGIELGPIAVIYFLVVAFFVMHAVVSLVLGIKAGREQRIRSSSKTLLLTVGIAVVTIFITNVIMPVAFNNLYFSTLGPLIGALAVGGVSYAVVRHGLFDIRLAAVRSVAYSLVLITLAGVYLIIAFAFSKMFNSELTGLSQTMSGVGISLLLALIFQPIKRFFDKYTNKFFYKDHYNSYDFIARLNKTLAVTTDLRDLLERTAIEIGHTLKSEQAFFYIYTLDGHYVSSGTPHHKQLSISDAFQLTSSNNLNREVLIASLMDPEDSNRRLMLSRRIELILPLVRSNKCVGYLCLGDHLTSSYTNRDMRVLDTISDELIIAIQNALAVQEIREFNETLKQQIANATKELRTKNIILQQLDKAKDEFVGMASHQLRTPLTSIKGYISMVLEGDAGKISGPQAQLLNEAFTSSERMVRLINDFLNVSRLQTGKFMIDKHPADLSKVVEQEIDSLQSNAVVHGMKFIYDLPKDFPMINIDEGKMRQVIMNFADNAIYYSHDGSTILINLSVDNNNVIFTVQDTGIGVPSDEQASLFTKFYRASNARKQRPDGTGVGLYLAKKIITAHDGKIIFNSTEGKGSTFGFSLPLKQN